MKNTDISSSASIDSTVSGYGSSTISSDSTSHKGVSSQNSFDSYIFDVRDADAFGEGEIPARAMLKMLKPRDDFVLRYPSDEGLKKVLIPPRKFDPLTKTELITMLQEDVRVQVATEQVHKLASIVYGNHKAVNGVMEEILNNPSSSSGFAEQISRSPRSVSSLAGIDLCCIKNQRRVDAEDNVSFLCSALVIYGRVVNHVEKEILRDYQKMQERRGQTVHMPSKDVVDFLNLPVKCQREILVTSSMMRDQVGNFCKKISSRLSSSDMQAIDNSNYQKLAKSLGVSRREARDITEMVQKASDAHDYSKIVKMRQQIAAKPPVHRSQAMAMNG
ncbi:BID domain-containing T4SS effector [Bartonella sp. B41]